MAPVSSLFSIVSVTCGLAALSSGLLPVGLIAAVKLFALLLPELLPLVHVVVAHHRKVSMLMTLCTVPGRPPVSCTLCRRWTQCNARWAQTWTESQTKGGRVFVESRYQVSSYHRHAMCLEAHKSRGACVAPPSCSSTIAQA